MLILLAGRSGVGKSTVAALLRDAGMFRVVNAGNVLGAELRRLGVEWRERHEIGTRFLESHHPAEIFPLLDEAVHHEQATGSGSSVAVDGIRFAVTCDQFRQRHPGTVVWYVTCDAALRLKRRVLAGQVRSADVGDSEEHLENAADVVIRNDGTLDELRTAVALVLGPDFSRAGVGN